MKRSAYPWRLGLALPRRKVPYADSDAHRAVVGGAHRVGCRERRQTGGILVPYLALFSGAVLLMGLPMFWLNGIVWLDSFADLSHTGRRLQEDAAVKRCEILHR